MVWGPGGVFALMVLINVSCSSPAPSVGPQPNPFIFSGALTYTGSLGTVDSTHNLAIEMNSSPAFRTSGAFKKSNAVNGDGYLLGMPGAGVYYLLAFFRSSIPACDVYGSSGFPIPHQGDPYFIYDGSLCGGSTPITVSAPVTLPINVSFDDSCLLNGVSGTIAYGGTSIVSSSQGIYVALYTDSAYVNLDFVAQEYLTCNSTNYSLGSLSGSTEYLQAFLDLAGTGKPAPGDPFVQYGPITPSPTLNVNLAFNDTTKFP